MNGPCWLCDIRPIESSRKPLCKTCYTFCHKRNLLHIFPSTTHRDKRIMAALEKYGYGFMDDMKVLERGESTLQNVASKYGISRERVRQIFEIFFDKKYTETVNARQSYHEEVKAKKRIDNNKFENRFVRAKKNCNTYVGIVAEHIFYEKCKSLGYYVCMKTGNYDADVNEFKVDVKSATHAVSMAKAGKQKYYRLSSRNKQYDIVDYYAFYIYENGAWYILPKTLLAKADKKYYGFYVPKYDITYRGFHKYRDLQQYREAWHLLAPPRWEHNR